MADNLGYTIFLDPADTVRAFEAREPLRPTVNWTEMMHEEHARAFTVAKLARLDLLREIYASLDDVIRNGGTFEQWRAAVLPQLQQAGWWGAVRDKSLTGTSEAVVVNDRRLRTIYDTNVRMSLAAGHWARIQRQKDVLPYLRYLPSSSEHKRPLHMTWYGILLPVDHPFWQTHFPPNGWGCKCHFEQVSEARRRRMGWETTPDSKLPVGLREFMPVGRDPIMVPDGIDPGFGYNPGTAHLRAIAEKAFASITQAVTAGLDDAAMATLRELVADPAFEQFIGAADAPFPVMILPSDLAVKFEAKTRVAVLSVDTMAKQLGKRADLPIDVYRRLPELAQTADVVALDGDMVLIFTRNEGNTWTFATVKRTVSGNGLFVTSVREQNSAGVNRSLKGTEILVDRR